MNRRLWIVTSFTAVVVLVGLAFGAGPAAAGTDDGFGQACKYDYLTYNACLSIYPGTSDDTRSVLVGIDLRMPANRPLADLRRGSSFRAMLYNRTAGPRPGIELDVRSGWPQAGHYVLSAQFGSDSMTLDRIDGTDAFEVMIAFTEVNADGSTTIHSYRTGIIYDRYH